MRIGLIIYGSIETISGGYLYDRKLVECLRARGDDVEIISLKWSIYGKHLGQNFSRDLLRHLGEAEFDVLLQDELNHPSLFWLNGRLRPHIPYPIVSIVHHLRCSEAHPRGLMPLYRKVERSYLRSVDGFVFNSQTTKREVELLSGVKRPFVVATPAGDRFHPSISQEAIKERCQQAGPLRILFVGNVSARKGLQTLIQALSGLQDVDWRLDVVGETTVSPTYTGQIQQQIQQKGLSKQISMLGSISDDELKHLYHNHHLLIVPSQYEGFGIVYLEGMGFGLPAIGTRGGAAGEIIEDGENGYLIDVGETAVLAQHIRHLHQNRNELTRLSLNAQKSSQSWPSWESSMILIRNFLEIMTYSKK